MATKKKTTNQKAKLEIICNGDEELQVKIDGDKDVLTVALACLMSLDDENNEFRQLMATAISVVVYKNQLDEKKAAKKKKLVKKKAAPKKKK